MERLARPHAATHASAPNEISNLLSGRRFTLAQVRVGQLGSDDPQRRGRQRKPPPEAERPCALAPSLVHRGTEPDTPARRVIRALAWRCQHHSAPRRTAGDDRENAPARPVPPRPPSSLSPIASRDRTPLKLAISPAGHHPRRRKPWAPASSRSPVGTGHQRPTLRRRLRREASVPFRVPHRPRRRRSNRSTSSATHPRALLPPYRARRPPAPGRSSRRMVSRAARRAEATSAADQHRRKIGGLSTDVVIAIKDCHVSRPPHLGQGVEIVAAPAAHRQFPARVSDGLGLCVKYGGSHQVVVEGRRLVYPSDSVSVRTPGCVWASEPGVHGFVSIDVAPELLPDDVRGQPSAVPHDGLTRRSRGLGACPKESPARVRSSDACARSTAAGTVPTGALSPTSRSHDWLRGETCASHRVFTRLHAPQPSGLRRAITVT